MPITAFSGPSGKLVDFADGALPEATLRAKLRQLFGLNVEVLFGKAVAPLPASGPDARRDPGPVVLPASEDAAWAVPGCPTAGGRLNLGFRYRHPLFGEAAASRFPDQDVGLLPTCSGRFIRRGERVGAVAAPTALQLGRLSDSLERSLRFPRLSVNRVGTNP